MNDRNNTIAGWVLGAGIVALGTSIVTGEVFHSERPEKMGFPIEGVVQEGAAEALGPELFGTPGHPIAAHPGFAYSDALKKVGGTWNWDNLSTWLASPKKFAPGTKMTFA